MEGSKKIDSRGALIVLEGLDRSGKTSRGSKLHYYLEESGHAVESWRFPRQKYGCQTNDFILSSQRVAFGLSCNSSALWCESLGEESLRSLMEAKLRSGTTLIVDRYSYSGIALSSAKGLDVEWCKAPDAGLLAPDPVVYLDISPEKAAERGSYGGVTYEELEFPKRVAQSYKMLFDDTWKTVDATLPTDDVKKRV